MKNEKIIRGNTEDEIWQQITYDLSNESDILEYSVTIEQQGKKILLDIDVDLGGGFEGGYESTMLRAPLRIAEHFKFVIHDQGFLDEIGKFFGMQDVEIGYPDFDKNLIIKSNDADKVKTVFADAFVRTVFQSYDDFTFGIIMHHSSGKEKAPFLEFYNNTAITNPEELRKIYSAFFKVLLQLETAEAQSY